MRDQMIIGFNHVLPLYSMNLSGIWPSIKTKNIFDRIEVELERMGDRLVTITKTVESYIGQIVEALNTKNRHDLLSDIELSPNKQVKEINIYSGNQLNDSPVVTEGKEHEWLKRKKG